MHTWTRILHYIVKVKTLVDQDCVSVTKHQCYRPEATSFIPSATYIFLIVILFTADIIFKATTIMFCNQVCDFKTLLQYTPDTATTMTNHKRHGNRDIFNDSKVQRIAHLKIVKYIGKFMYVATMSWFCFSFLFWKIEEEGKMKGNGVMLECLALLQISVKKPRKSDSWYTVIIKGAKQLLVWLYFIYSIHSQKPASLSGEFDLPCQSRIERAWASRAFAFHKAA